MLLMMIFACVHSTIRVEAPKGALDTGGADGDLVVELVEAGRLG